MMNIEIRADGAHISGYVNVTEKKSRPVITPHGKVVEETEPRAFQDAIDRAGNINVTVDHDSTHIYASTEAKTLTFYEDNIGLHADVLITDTTIIELAKQGKVRGWSIVTPPETDGTTRIIVWPLFVPKADRPRSLESV